MSKRVNIQTTNEIIRAEKCPAGWVSFFRPDTKDEPGPFVSVVGIFPSEETALEAAKAAKDLWGTSRVCTLADIDRVRREIKQGKANA